ncbi:MAG: hypothetical protein KGQ41_08190 [Alphaproteobacteria bacterium]|nr:hypothetical protein [Alphaproteobacteria bacterium]
MNRLKLDIILEENLKEGEFEINTNYVRVAKTGRYEYVANIAHKTPLNFSTKKIVGDRTFSSKEEAERDLRAKLEDAKASLRKG